MDAIKAWKDMDYRESLSNVDLAAVPTHPAGLVSLDLGDLATFAGGTNTSIPCEVTIGVTFKLCSERTLCGTCGFLSTGCC